MSIANYSSCSVDFSAGLEGVGRSSLVATENRKPLSVVAQLFVVPPQRSNEISGCCVLARTYRVELDVLDDQTFISNGGG